MTRTHNVTIRFSDRELKRLDALVRRQLRKGTPADRSSVVRQLIEDTTTKRKTAK